MHDFHEIRKKGWRFACRPGFIYCFPLAKWSFGAPRPTGAPHPRARSPCCFAVITITTIGAYTRGFIFIPLGTKRDSNDRLGMLNSAFVTFGCFRSSPAVGGQVMVLMTLRLSPSPWYSLFACVTTECSRRSGRVRPRQAQVIAGQDTAEARELLKAKEELTELLAVVVREAEALRAEQEVVERLHKGAAAEQEKSVGVCGRPTAKSCPPSRGSACPRRAARRASGYRARPDRAGPRHARAHALRCLHLRRVSAGPSCKVRIRSQAMSFEG